jgi:N-acetyl-gamma-glutamyl-phosphate reductase
MTTFVGIVGFRGYSGAELVRILERHTDAEPVLLEHRSDSTAEVMPRGAKRHKTIACTPDAVIAQNLQAVFLATPPEVSMDLAPWLLESGAKVIDLSGAFRLRTPENYKHWYKAEHTEPELLKEAVYA